MTKADPFGRLTAGERALLRPAPLPETVEPMLAVLTEERFSDPAWLYERKLDGIRCIAIKGDRDVRLLSRNNLSQNTRFPEIAAALEADPATQLVLDGEIVAFSGGRTSFELPAAAQRAPRLGRALRVRPAASRRSRHHGVAAARAQAAAATCRRLPRPLCG